MKYHRPDNRLFKNNRERFVAQMEPNSIAIFHSNYQYSWNGDALYKFKQNSDIFWLSGIDQEDSVLVLFPDCPIAEFRECLYIMETNEHIATWEGHKYTKEEARDCSGIQTVEAVLNMGEATNHFTCIWDHNAPTGSRDIDTQANKAQECFCKDVARDC